MFSSQRDSTEDVWVNDKIAHVGVNQRCALTHMQRKKKNKTKKQPKPFSSAPHQFGLKDIYAKIKVHSKEQFS